MTENDLPPNDQEPAQVRIRIARPKFKAPVAKKENRRQVKLLTSDAIAIAINVEAARRDVTVCALLLDALRRTFPAVAVVIEQEAKKSAA